MNDNAPVSDESGGALDEANEVVGDVAGNLSSGEFTAELAADVADLAHFRLGRVAGRGVGGAVGVEVTACGGAGAGGVDGADVDVEVWGVLVCGDGRGRG